MEVNKKVEVTADSGAKSTVVPVGANQADANSWSSDLQIGDRLHYAE